MSEWVMARKKREWVPERLWALLRLLRIADTRPIQQITTAKCRLRFGLRKLDRKAPLDWNIDRWRSNPTTEYAAWRNAGFPDPPPEITNEFRAMMRGRQ